MIVEGKPEKRGYQLSLEGQPTPESQEIHEVIEGNNCMYTISDDYLCLKKSLFYQTPSLTRSIPPLRDTQ